MSHASPRLPSRPGFCTACSLAVILPAGPLPAAGKRLPVSGSQIPRGFTALELDVARIDQPSIAKRFDSLEGKIDKLYEFLPERFSEGMKDAHR